MVHDPRLDYYVVMSGPSGAAVSSRGGTRPLLIEGVYLFDAARLLDALRAQGLKIGVATSVRRGYWQEAEIFPRQRSRNLLLSQEQQGALALFSDRRQS